MTKLIPIFFLLLVSACGGGPSPAVEAARRAEDDQARGLRLQAREQEVRRLTSRLEMDATRRRYQINDDINLLEERLTGARLAWDALRAADLASRAKAESDFDAALETLTQTLAEVKSRTP
jgi:hypothetical protein